MTLPLDKAVHGVGVIGLLMVLVLPWLRLKLRWEHAIGAWGLAAFLLGQYLGLFWAPPERMMGEVGRILYVHVPAAWLAMVTFTVAFVGALGFLMTSKRGWDYTVEAAVEVGIMLNALLLVLGAIFAKPTWNVWWTWDPRLTASAIMLLTFVGVQLLRSAVADGDRRATWSAIATVLAYINIPITYLSVRWWRSIHQTQSSPETVNPDMVFVLRLNAYAFLFLTIWFLVRRWRVAHARDLADQPPELPPVTTAVIG